MKRSNRAGARPPPRMRSRSARRPCRRGPKRRPPSGSKNEPRGSFGVRLGFGLRFGFVFLYEKMDESLG